MDLFASIESRIEKVMGRLFSIRKGARGVQPVMIAQEAVKAMESARQVSVEAVYVPNHFEVRLHPVDYEAIRPVQLTITRDCVTYLSKVAHRRRLSFAGPVILRLIADDEIERGALSVSAFFREAREDAPVGDGKTARHALSPRDSLQSSVDVEGTRRYERVESPAATLAPSRLEVIDGERGASLLLIPGETYLIGRADDSDLQLLDSRVSRRHARLLYEGGHWWIEDLQTTNGTRKNGAPIRRERLHDGDAITVGLTTIRYVERS